jgi:hypothetical protein
MRIAKRKQRPLGDKRSAVRLPERLGELGVVDLAIARRVEMVHQKHQRAVIEGHLMRKAIRRHQ